MDPSKSRLREWRERPPRDYSKSWLRESRERKVLPTASSQLPSEIASSERPKVAEPPEHIAAHHDNVLLALGSLAIVGGIGLLTASWLGFLALALAPSNAHPSGSYAVEGWVIVSISTLVLLFGIYIFLAFFFGWHLPSTAKEKARAEREEGGTLIVRQLTDEEAQPPDKPADN